MQLDQFELQFEQFVLEQEIHDAAHDINHIKRVVSSAKQLAKAEGANENIVVPAAWLHDCVSFAKSDPNNKRASLFAAEKATQFLSAIGYPEQYHPAIAHAIAAHSYSANIATESIEAEVVQDADRLDGLGAIGVSRCMLVAGKLGSQLYASSDPFCQNRSPDSKVAAIDHFYEKLFKTATSMNTEAGMAEAKKRVSFMQGFLRQLAVEMGVDTKVI